MFRRKPQQSRRLTGARTILKAEHRDQATGVVHGHEWEITAWWRWTGTSAEVRQHQLNETIEPYQDKCLPDSIAWAENLASYIGRNMEHGWSAGDPDCVIVEVVRHKEGLLARWER
jgi:hypothetical protein